MDVLACALSSPWKFETLPVHKSFAGMDQLPSHNLPVPSHARND